MKPHYKLVNGVPVPMIPDTREVPDVDLEKFREAWLEAKLRLEAKWAREHESSGIDRLNVIGSPTGCNLAGSYVLI